MPERKIDRFKILVGRGDYADHIFEITEDQLDELRDEIEVMRTLAGDQPTGELEPIEDVLHSLTENPTRELTAEDKDILRQMMSSLGWQIPGELLCNQGRKSAGSDLMSLSAYTGAETLDEIDFQDEPPGELCSFCWSNTAEMLQEEATLEDQGVSDRIGSVGYRLRWKQKGRAREEWYDIVVRPETTMAELDSLVCRFSTLDDFHLRMYGLEDEYLDSSIKVVPDHQHSTPSDTPASEMTIAEVAKQATLWEGDRLSLVYDYGTPSHYYCIVKEVCDSDELDAVLSESESIAATDSAAIVDQKRPS